MCPHIQFHGTPISRYIIYFLRVLVTILLAFTLSAVTTNITCYGSASGAIQISPIGGIEPFVYQWHNSGGDVINETANITNLVSGAYYVIATDSSGCSVRKDITVAENGIPFFHYFYACALTLFLFFIADPIITTVSVTPVCHSLSDASAFAEGTHGGFTEGGYNYTYVLLHHLF